MNPPQDQSASVHVHVREHTLESLLEDNLRLYHDLSRLADQFRLWKGSTGKRGGLLGEVRATLEALK